MSKNLSFSSLAQLLNTASSIIPEHRIGKNVTYSLQDAVLGAFSVFFMQSASFLAHQLEPEFIVPQDGHEKQDCERAAAKRWLERYGDRYATLKVTMLGDDLFCNQPLCEAVLEKKLNFIFVCKPDSHTELYQMVEFLEANGQVEQFSDLRALTRYLYFESWEHLMDFMIAKLKLSPPLDSG